MPTGGSQSAYGGERAFNYHRRDTDANLMLGFSRETELLKSDPTLVEVRFEELAATAAAGRRGQQAALCMRRACALVIAVSSGSASQTRSLWGCPFLGGCHLP